MPRRAPARGRSAVGRAEAVWRGGDDRDGGAAASSPTRWWLAAARGGEARRRTGMAAKMGGGGRCPPGLICESDMDSFRSLGSSRRCGDCCAGLA